MSTITAIKGVEFVATSSNGSRSPESTSGRSFSEVMLSVGSTSLNDLHRDLVNMYNALRSSKEMSPKELLLYQIKAGQFGLRVELVSKIGESLTATVRRFEQGQ